MNSASSGSSPIWTVVEAACSYAGRVAESTISAHWSSL